MVELTTWSRGPLHCWATRRTLQVLALFVIHPLLHQILQVPILVPFIILILKLLGTSILAGFDIEFVNIAEMSFAGDVGEQM